MIDYKIKIKKGWYSLKRDFAFKEEIKDDIVKELQDRKDVVEIEVFFAKRIFYSGDDK